MMTPAHVAYGALASAWAPTGAPTAGTCGLCGTDGDVWEALGVLSRRFSSWGLLAVDEGTGRRWLCARCAWAMTSPGALRRERLVIRPDGVEQATWGTLGGLLVDGALSAGACVVAPSGGKKTLLPYATWGRVVSDAGVLAWTCREAQVLRSGRFLRGLGASEGDLAEAAPPPLLLDRLEVAQRGCARAAWGVWGPWMNGPWAGVLVRATRTDENKTKTTNGGAS